MAVSTDAEVINIALMHLGQRNLQPTDIVYRRALERLPQIRDSALRSYNWNFALNQGFFNPTTNPAPNIPTGIAFPYTYDIPNDCILIKGVASSYEDLSNYGISSEFDDWKATAGRKLQTTANAQDTMGNSGVWVWYIQRNTNVSEWDPIFVELVAIELAITCASFAKIDQNQYQVLAALRNDTKARAEDATDAESSPEIYQITSEWIEAGYGRGFHRYPYSGVYLRTTQESTIIVHTNHYALIDENGVLTEQEAMNRMEFDTNEFQMPTWTSGRRFLFIGVRENGPDIRQITQGGFNVFSAFERVPGVIDGIKWWKTRNSQTTEASGATYGVL